VRNLHCVFKERIVKIAIVVNDVLSLKQVVKTDQRQNSIRGLGQLFNSLKNFLSFLFRPFAVFPSLSLSLCVSGSQRFSCVDRANCSL
jgi:hypothetical protein